MSQDSPQKKSIQLGCVSHDGPQRKSILQENGKLGITLRSQVLEGQDASRKKFGKEGSIAGNHLKVRTSGAKSIGSQIRGKNARRNCQTGAMRPQRRLGTGKGCSQTERGVKRYVLLSCRSLGNAGTLFDPRIRRTPAHVIFCRVAQELTHQVRIHVSLTKTVHSSHLAQHVALSLFSFRTDHHLTFQSLHLHSNPTLFLFVNQTFIDNIFTR